VYAKRPNEPLCGGKRKQTFWSLLASFDAVQIFHLQQHRSTKCTGSPAAGVDKLTPHFRFRRDAAASENGCMCVAQRGRPLGVALLPRPALTMLPRRNGQPPGLVDLQSQPAPLRFPAASSPLFSHRTGRNLRIYLWSRGAHSAVLIVSTAHLIYSGDPRSLCTCNKRFIVLAQLAQPRPLVELLLGGSQSYVISP
jgi:hypothetical protein